MEASLSDPRYKHDRQIKSINSTELIDRYNDTSDLLLLLNKTDKANVFSKENKSNKYTSNKSKNLLRIIKDKIKYSDLNYRKHFLSSNTSEIGIKDNSNKIPKLNMKNHFKEYFENRPIVELKKKVFTYTTEEKAFELKIREKRLQNSIHPNHKSYTEKLFRLININDNNYHKKVKNFKKHEILDKNTEINDRNESENNKTNTNSINTFRKKRASIKAFKTDLITDDKEEHQPRALDKFLKRKEKLEFLIPEFRDDILYEEEIDNENKINENDSVSSINEIEINDQEVDTIKKRINKNKKDLSKQLKFPISLNSKPNRKQFVLKDFNHNNHPEFKKAHQSKSELKFFNIKNDLMANPFFKNINEVARTTKIFNQQKKINSSRLIIKKTRNNMNQNSNSYDLIDNLNKINEKRDKVLNEMIRSKKSLI